MPALRVELVARDKNAEDIACAGYEEALRQIQTELGGWERGIVDGREFAQQMFEFAIGRRSFAFDGSLHKCRLGRGKIRLPAHDGTLTLIGAYYWDWYGERAASRVRGPTVSLSLAFDRNRNWFDRISSDSLFCGAESRLLGSPCRAFTTIAQCASGHAVHGEPLGHLGPHELLGLDAFMRIQIKRVTESFFREVDFPLGFFYRGFRDRQLALGEGNVQARCGACIQSCLGTGNKGTRRIRSITRVRKGCFSGPHIDVGRERVVARVHARDVEGRGRGFNEVG